MATFKVKGIGYETLTNDTVKVISYRNIPSHKLIIPPTVENDGNTYSVVEISVPNFEDRYTFITSVIIPNGVTRIGEHSFSDCSDLTTIKIPSSVTSIGDFAFHHYGRRKNMSVYITDLAAWCKITFAVWANPLSHATNFILNGKKVISMTIPDGVTNIPDCAFENFLGLKSVKIPNTVASIGNSAFYECSNLKSVSIPSSVKRIGEIAFANCTHARFKFEDITGIEVADNAFKGVIRPIIYGTETIIAKDPECEVYVASRNCVEFGTASPCISGEWNYISFSGVLAESNMQYLALPDTFRKIPDYTFAKRIYYTSHKGHDVEIKNHLKGLMLYDNGAADLQLEIGDQGGALMMCYLYVPDRFLEEATTKWKDIFMAIRPLDQVPFELRDIKP